MSEDKVAWPNKLDSFTIQHGRLASIISKNHTVDKDKLLCKLLLTNTE